MTDKTDLKQLAEQMAKHVSSFEDIKAFQKQLMQSFIDTALESEMEEHLGYAKHEKAGKANSRNGHIKKTVQSDTGELKIGAYPNNCVTAYNPPKRRISNDRQNRLKTTSRANGKAR